MRALEMILVGIVLAGCGRSSSLGDSRTRTVGSLTAQLTPEPDPPRVGHDSGFVVTVAENGSPVSGAAVRMDTAFTGLNQTGPSAVLTETSPGRYEAREVSTGMNGKWEATVTITRINQPDVQLTFPFTVGK